MFGHFLVGLQLIHRLTQADISCTTTARLFFFPLLAHYAGGLGRCLPAWPALFWQLFIFPPKNACHLMPPLRCNTAGQPPYHRVFLSLPTVQ